MLFALARLIGTFVMSTFLPAIGLAASSEAGASFGWRARELYPKAQRVITVEPKFAGIRDQDASASASDVSSWVRQPQMLHPM